MFADDTNVYRSIQDDLFKICDWGELWLLEFSIPKCKALQYGYIRLEHTYQMRDSGNEIIDIPTESEEKDLGILFEKSLKFNKHVLNVVNRSKKLTGLIRRTFRYMNKTLLLQVYKSMIRSITYAALRSSPRRTLASVPSSR